MDLTKLFQCSVMEKFNDIMSDGVKSMSINNTSEWWALRTKLDVRMKVNNKALCLLRLNYIKWNLEFFESLRGMEIGLNNQDV